MSEQPQVQPPAVTPPNISPKSGKFDELKSTVIKVLIGCLIAAAGLAVFAVLLGGLSEILTRSLLTLGLVAAHAIGALGYISTTDKDDDDLTIFSNAVFTVIVLSFVTSVLGTWEIIGLSLVGKLYATYCVVLFAVLHGELLYKTRGKTNTINQVVTVNYGFMSVVVGMLLMVIYLEPDSFGDMYYRFLAALGIIDATLTITAVALHRLYLGKHPEAAKAEPPAKKRRFGILTILLIIFLLFQVLGMLFGAIFRTF